MSQTHRWLQVTTLGAALALVAGACASAATSPSLTFQTTPIATVAPTGAPTATPVPTFDYSAITFTPGTEAAPRSVDIVADELLTFTPGVVVVVQGETVKFNVTVKGKAVHEFMVGPVADAFGDVEGTPEVADIQPGTTQSLTYTFKGPGPFAFACHAAGHFEHGMKGWIIVVGPDVPTVGTKDNPRLVHLDMTDKLKFTPNQVSVAPGETVRFILTNSGEATHEFAVGPADKVAADQIDGVIVAEADEILAGMTKDLVYTFNGPGPYGFACHEPGHFEAGMQGTVVFTAK